MSKASKLGRRRFLKYVGAGAVAVGGVAAAYYLRNTRLERGPEGTIPTTTQTATSTKTNLPPVASFKYKPHYLNPTDQQTIQFTNTSYDPDGDSLSTTWLVDHEEVSTIHDYSIQLPKGEHWVTIQVSDGKEETGAGDHVTVEFDQIYPTRQLHIKHKGLCYCAGSVAPEWGDNPNPSTEEMDEQLDTIHDELGCNAIVIFAGGDHEDALIECSRLAIEKGFDRIYVGPEYMALSPDETVERLRRLAPRVRELRETSKSIVFLVGHEFGLETAIVSGSTWLDRIAALNRGEGWDQIRATLPKMFRDIIATCKKNYGYEIAYRAIAYVEVDLVPWEDPMFESVGVDAYVQEGVGWTEDWIVNLLSRLKRYRKPVYSMEAGCYAIKGAGRFAGQAPTVENPYDEDEQANYIRRYCEMLNRARIDGYFYTFYNSTWDKGYGLYNGKKRKKGFYMYKSYERVY
jgi:hypothetical protein